MLFLSIMCKKIPIYAVIASVYNTCIEDDVLCAKRYTRQEDEKEKEATACLLDSQNRLMINITQFYNVHTIPIHRKRVQFLHKVTACVLAHF